MGFQRNTVIVRAVRDQHQSVAETARRYNVSRQWVYTLLRRYEEHGTDGLRPASRAPRRRPHTTAEAVQQKVTALRQELVAAGADAGTAVLMLIEDDYVRTSDANTGEIIAEHTIDPAKDYQPRTR